MAPTVAWKAVIGLNGKAIAIERYVCLNSIGASAGMICRSNDKILVNYPLGYFKFDLLLVLKNLP